MEKTKMISRFTVLLLALVGLWLLINQFDACETILPPPTTNNCPAPQNLEAQLNKDSTQVIYTWQPQTESVIYILKRDDEVIASKSIRENALKFPTLVSGTYTFEVIPDCNNTVLKSIDIDHRVAHVETILRGANINTLTANVDCAKNCDIEIITQSGDTRNNLVPAEGYYDRDSLCNCTLKDKLECWKKAKIQGQFNRTTSCN